MSQAITAIAYIVPWLLVIVPGLYQIPLAPPRTLTPESEAMMKSRRRSRTNELSYLGCFAVSLSIIFAWAAIAKPQNDFPDGYDAVQAAPDSHKIIFENALVRILEVPIPTVGKPEPMHHHRWPSVFLHWDTGGKTPHIQYHRPDGSVRDIPSRDLPPHPGHWVASWMPPEPMHWVETLDSGAGQEPPYLRVEIKTPF